MLTTEDKKLLDKVFKQSDIFEWWQTFVRNIEKQGWMSPKQRRKIESFNYKCELNRAYGRGIRKNQVDWASGLDHDEIVDYTGESCSGNFYS